MSAKGVPVGISEDSIRNYGARNERCRACLRGVLTLGCPRVKPADLLGNGHHSHT